MISLTTSYDPGDLDAGNTYPKADVVNESHNRQAEVVDLSFEYGTEAAGKLIPGKATAVPMRIYNDESSTDYDDLMAMLSNDGEKSAASYNRCLCQFAIDKGIFAGTAS